MKVLSLFDGISCARVAFGECDYYSSEIDKYAIKVSTKNFPTIKRLGDVSTVKAIPDLFLLIGGSPCQDLSIAKKGRKGLSGTRSGLFYQFVRVLRESKPKYFILENVNSMTAESRDTISKELGCQPIMINASLVSAQSRKRLFWTNIPVVGLPADRRIFLKDILEGSNTGLYKIGRNIGRRLDKDGKRQDDSDIPITRRIETRADDKSGTLTSVAKDNLVIGEGVIRKLTPIECERLQGLPDNYTEGISTTQRYKCLGTAFNVDVIKFILSFAI
jgi:site-specific DNA-cytosine methylase